MRGMRNAMAHQLALTLSDSEFTNKVREIFVGPQIEGLPDNNKTKVACAGRMLIIILSERIREVVDNPPIKNMPLRGLLEIGGIGVCIGSER